MNAEILKLQRQVNRLKYGILALTILAIMPWLIAAAPNDGNDTVVCKSLIVVDDRGNPRVGITMQENQEQARISLLDKEGMELVGISEDSMVMSKNGSATLISAERIGHRGKDGSNVVIADNTLSVATRDGKTTLCTGGEVDVYEGEERLSISPGKAFWYDDKGTGRIIISILQDANVGVNSTGIAMYDKNGNQTYQLSP